MAIIQHNTAVYRTRASITVLAPQVELQDAMDLSLPNSAASEVFWGKEEEDLRVALNSGGQVGSNYSLYYTRGGLRSVKLKIWFVLEHFPMLYHNLRTFIKKNGRL